MAAEASRSCVDVDVAFIRRAGKALVVSGFVALGLTGWVAVGEHQIGGLVGAPLGLVFISYGIDVIGYPRQRRVLGPKDTSEWLLRLLARVPAALEAPALTVGEIPDGGERIQIHDGHGSADPRAGPGQAA